MGWDYVQFRVFYILRNKLGILKRQFPTNPKVKNFISLVDWKKQSINFFFNSKEQLAFEKNSNNDLKERYDDFIAGKLWYFNAIQYHIGRDYDWLTNPDNQYKYDTNRHWSDVADLSSEAGDIKFVWEKSRFSYLHDIIRYDYHFDKDCSELVFTEIENWIAANPINQGPNFKCSQEISLRTLNWLFALYYYKNSVALTEERFQKVIHVIYWQIKHDYANINFSRKTVRNNHAVTECLMLYLGGLLLPFLPEANLWKSKGKQWFEEEIAYQVYEDGTFLQFSHNYQRVLVQLLTWAFYLSDANDEKFSPIVYQKAKKTLDYLYQCQEPYNGYLPNYGANDGALFFKLNDSTYRDYRPQLNALYYFFTDRNLYENKMVQEDVNWYINNSKKRQTSTDYILQHREMSQYTEGGAYLMRDKESFTFLKCTQHKDRPSHADNLHIDIWYKGENIIRDAGTYKYNTDADLVKYFTGTAAHNTVMLGNNSQMLKGPRFIWLNWSNMTKTNLEDKGDYWEFEGTIQAFGHIDKNIHHTRKLRKYKTQLSWEVNDSLQHKEDLPMIQIWNITDDFEVKFNIEAFDTEGVEIPKKYVQGYYSGMYGIKEKSRVIYFETKSKSIKTYIRHK